MAHYRAKHPNRIHRVGHAGLAASKSYKARDTFIIQEEKLRRGSCLVCGLAVTVQTAVVFDFDHRDRRDKVDNIAKIRGRHKSTEYLLAEMSKCDLLCCLCHRMKTVKSQDWSRLGIEEGLQEPLFDN